MGSVVLRFVIGRQQWRRAATGIPAVPFRDARSRLCGCCYQYGAFDVVFACRALHSLTDALAHGTNTSHGLRELERLRLQLQRGHLHENSRFSER